MEVQKQKLGKSQLELTVEIPFEEFKGYFDRGAQALSKEVKIEGFREGKVPFDVLKQKVGEGAILEKSAREAVNDTLPKAMEKVEGTPIDQPSVEITKIEAEKPLEYKAVVTLLPEINLGSYKDFGFKEEEVKVEEGEIKNYMEYLRDMRAKEAAVDREVKEGDKVTMTIERFSDGQSLDGGKPQQINNIIGKEQVTEGFDEKIKGAKKGDALEFKLTYPEDSFNKQLAGKEVAFNVKIDEIYQRELPEINDEFAKSMGSENLEKLKEGLIETAKKEKEQHAKKHLESKILNQVVENTEFGEMPKSLIQQEAERMLEELSREVSSQGGTFEEYLKRINKSRDDLKKELRPQAVKRLKTALAVREIIKQEDIKVTEKEIEEKRQELLNQYKGYEKVEEYIKKPEYDNQLYSMLADQKLMDKLKDWNVKKGDKGDKGDKD